MIQNIQEKIKALGITLDDVFLVVIILLVALMAFGLGRLSVLYEKKSDGFQVIHAESGDKIGDDSFHLNVPKGNTNEKKYVASLSGSKYHLPHCSGAQRIREENRIWFATKEDAEIAGYTPALNCPGL